MPLLKEGKVVEDLWTPLPEDAEPAPQGRIIVTLEQWQAGRERLRGHNGRLGLRLKSDQSPAQIVDDLHYFDLIALEFPRFGDGRAYSYARLLRERYSFTGELRAVGNVLRDQLLFMVRCGFDAFEVANENAAEAWRDAMAEISLWYQPTGRSGPSLGVLRRAALPSAR
ncbi:MAG: DUF934 domain-containing protein [Kiloniellaceae bacterium]|jgi:uncharacterized protein (DUF934 family)|nr:DUF934 domain-containing protein [Kiloniellaceae bacterium]